MKKKHKTARNDSDENKRESGEPGGGQGRKDYVGRSGVHPASAGNAPAGSEIRTQAAWGQGERGAAGAEDAGQSELFFYPSELEAAEQAEKKQAEGDALEQKDK